MNKASVLALFVSLVALGFSFSHSTTISGAGASGKEAAFDRVMRTRTLRCAYALWPPYFLVDPNARNFSGINYEIVEAIGKRAGWKIEWAEEVGFGSIAEQLATGKEDAFCSGAWMGLPRAKRAEYTMPLEYSQLFVFVKSASARKNVTLEAMNDPSFTFSAIEGSTSLAVMEEAFPKAKHLTLPENSQTSESVEAVASGKADAVVLDDYFIDGFNENNPTRRLMRLAGASAVRTFGAAMVVAKKEWELRDLLNVAIQELQDDGTIDRIVKKYEKTPDSILRPMPGYSAAHGR